jgi:hypothetical protein
MKWEFKLTLQYRNTEHKTGFSVDGYDELVSNNFIQLLSQFNILIASVLKKIHEQEMEEKLVEKYDDQIPF